MPYGSIRELPKSIKDNLPKHAQEIFKESFNSAWDNYSDPSERRGKQSREQVARKVAWNAVKQDYEKGDDGKWHKK